MMQSTYSDIMKNRELFYGFLSRLYEKELSPGLLDQLKNLSYPDDCDQAEMRDGYRLLKASVQASAPNLAEDFAVDYAKVFLSAGESNGKAAFPYESTYTSKTGLVMQEAWAKVKDIYAAKGLGLTTAMSDVKEDHIAVEMLYMAQLCQQFLDDKDQSGLDEQLEFLNEHLLNWVPAFCADIGKYARTDFYKGLSKLTLGYLKYDQEVLDSLAAENKAPEIHSYYLSPAEMDQVFNKLKERYKIFAPKFLEKRGPKGQDIVRYQQVASVGEIVYDQPSAFSAKEVYYPIMQTMFYFGEDSYAESEIDTSKDLLIFLRPCDINAMRRLDSIFLENGGQADVYYARLRDRVKIVMMECNESYENCFCASMGSNTTDNYSLAVRMAKDGIKIQVKDNAFHPYFSGKGDGYVEFTIRKIGRLTDGIFGLAEGDTLFMRGPYGNHFPVEQFENKDLVVICGGTGMAPVRTTLNHFYHHPEVSKSVHLIAGFKDIESVLFTEELEKFKGKFNTIYTLDNSEAPGFRSGFVTAHINEIPFDSFGDYNVVIVGPPGMMNAAARECLANGVEKARIWVSFERKMSCAVGKCGHCKINETYVCLEGPVFNYTKASTMFD